ncbi:MAG: hypothetical protein WKF75_06735 [Singulisphaera sp.]
MARGQIGASGLAAADRWHLALDEEVPLSDSTFDDSGYATSIRFSRPIADPTSLAQMRDSAKGRGGRGIAFLEAKLAALPPDDPRTPSGITNHELLIASLLMYEGKWAAASEHFAKAQAADPARPAEFRATVDALRGVAALRRGEVENCVAAATSEPHLPLASAAVHLRPPARARRSPTSPATRGGGRRTWGPVAAELTYMTLGEYPEVPPSSSCRWADSPSWRVGPRAGWSTWRHVSGSTSGARPWPAGAGRRLRRRRPPRPLHADDRPAARASLRATMATAPLKTARLGGTGRSGHVPAGLPRRLRQRRRLRRPDAQAWEVPRRMSPTTAAMAPSRTSPCPPASANRSPRRPPAGPTTTTTACRPLRRRRVVAHRHDLRNRGRLYHNRGGGTFATSPRRPA